MWWEGCIGGDSFRFKPARSIPSGLKMIPDNWKQPDTWRDKSRDIVALKSCKGKLEDTVTTCLLRFIYIYISWIDNFFNILSRKRKLFPFLENIIRVIYIYIYIKLDAKLVQVPRPSSFNNSSPKSFTNFPYPTCLIETSSKFRVS